MIGISIFGGQITINMVITDLADPGLIQNTESSWASVFQKQKWCGHLLQSAGFCLQYPLRWAFQLKCLALSSLPGGWVGFLENFDDNTIHNLVAITTILPSRDSGIRLSFLSSSSHPLRPRGRRWIGVAAIYLSLSLSVTVDTPYSSLAATTVYRVSSSGHIGRQRQSLY
jgi:hypothetical protein